MMLDIVLIQLPNPQLAQPKMYNPLGLMYLEASLRRTGFSVQVLDFRDGELKIPETRYVGFSCTTPEITKAKEIARRLKKERDVITLVGGAHPTLLPEDCVPSFDVVFQGEGEVVLPFIMKLNHKKGRVAANRIEDLDLLLYPNRKIFTEPYTETLMPGERYGIGEKAATVIWSRGCPYNCSFCGNMLNTPVLYRSVGNIIGEIKELLEDGVSQFRVEDDNITLHPEFEKICHRLSKLPVNFKAHTRSDLVTEENANLLALAGCVEFGLGVESADDIVLRLNNKKETCQDHSRAVSFLKKVGIKVKTYFMAGLPGETEDTLQLNMEFVDEARPDKWTVSTFIPYPGCDVWTNPDKYGVEIIDWDFSKWWNFADRFVHRLKGQTGEEMYERYRRFYDWLRARDSLSDA